MSKRLRRWSSSGQVSAPTTPSPTDFSYQSPNLTTPTSVPSNDYGYDDYDDDDQRWSEVIPPKAALTFAPVWDPDHDTVRFSGAQLLNLNESSEEERISPTDACSQVLTVGHSTLPLSEPTSTLQFFQDHYDYLFSSRSGAQSRQSWERGGDRERRKKVGRTQTSSTLDGLDVYLRGSLMLNNNNDDRRHGKDERYFSCLEYLDQDFDFDPRTSFAKKYFQDFSEDNNNDKDALSSSSSSSSVSDGNVSDEGFFEVSDLTRCGQRHEREGAARTRDKRIPGHHHHHHHHQPHHHNHHNHHNNNPISALSNSPHGHRNTNNNHNNNNNNTSSLISSCRPSSSSPSDDFVSINDSDASSEWSTLDRPESPMYAQLLIASQQRNSVRRLKKRRPSELPVPPVEVLQREIFSHQVSVPIPVVSNSSSPYSSSSPSKASPSPSSTSRSAGVNGNGNGNGGGSGSGSNCQTLNQIVHCLSNTLPSRKKSQPEMGRWMCVEVTQEVRQHFG